MQYRKKPVVVEAMQLDNTHETMRKVTAWAHVGLSDQANCIILPSGVPGSVIVRTAEGEMYGQPGDWIIRGVAGEFYPCKPEIFAATYEPAAAPPASQDERFAMSREEIISEGNKMSCEGCLKAWAINPNHQHYQPLLSSPKMFQTVACTAIGPEIYELFCKATGAKEKP